MIIWWSLYLRELFLVYSVQSLSLSQGVTEASLGLLSWSAVCSYSLWFRVPLSLQRIGVFGGRMYFVAYRVLSMGVVGAACMKEACLFAS